MRTEFSARTRRAAFERADGRCEECHQPVGIVGWDVRYDHAVPDWLGGKNDLDNCTCLCIGCHSEKTRLIDVPRIAKTKRLEAERLHGKKPSRQPMPGSRRTKWKRTMSGKTVLRSPN